MGREAERSWIYDGNHGQNRLHVRRDTQSGNYIVSVSSNKLYIQTYDFMTNLLERVVLSCSNRVEAWTRAVNFTLRQEGRPTPRLVGNSSTKRVTTDWRLADRAVDWLKKTGAKVDGPFLLYVGLNLPRPYGTPEEGENAGASTFRTSPYWLNYVDKSKVTIPQWMPLDQMHPVDFYDSKVKNCTSNFTHDEIFKVRQYYYAMCAETDAMLGQIMDCLREIGKEEESYVFFSSDHGEMAIYGAPTVLQDDNVRG